MRIRPILPDNGKEFTDRLFGLRQRAATGAHECDTLGAALDIDHRLTPPRSPQTNGIVERFNGRIEEVLQSHPFRSGEVLEATLLRYVWLYTQPLPQSALGSKTPLQALKGWRKLKLELVRKQPYYLPGCDSYTATGVGASHGGSVTFVSTPASGARITLRRLLPVQRITDFQEGGDFRAATLNDELDYQTAALQSVQSDMERGLRLAPTDTETATTLPAKGERAGKLLAFDTEGKPVVLPPSIDLPNDASTSFVTGAGQVAPRTLADRFSALPTVLDKRAKGDGGTDDGPVLTALTAPHVLPEGSYAVNADDLPAVRPYNVCGAGELVDPNATESPLRARMGLLNDRGMGHSLGMLASLLPDLAGPHMDLAALDDAIALGTAKVVFVGDSITEAADVEEENTWTALLRQNLERIFPEVAWSFANLSLGSRHAEHLADPAYLALTSEPVDKDLGFFRAPANDFPRESWQTGSVSGKSWRDHVKDEAPDLVIWAHGMNNFHLSGLEYYTAVTAFLDFASTWAKTPTVVLATTFLPTRLDPAYRVRQVTHDGHYRILRDLAVIRRLGVIDANRVYHYLRDGIDEGRRQWFREDDFRGWNTAWWGFLEGGSGQVALSGGRLQFSGMARPRRKLLAADFQADLTWRSADAGDVLAFNYSIDPDNSADRYEFQWSGPNLKIYWKGVVKLSAVDVAASVGTDNYVRVRCDGARHRLWINGVLKLDGNDFESLAEGSCAYRAYLGSGAAAEVGCTLKIGYTARYARPLLHEDDLIGTGDWGVNADSAGGNGINHPSTAGHYLIYGPAVGAFATALRLQKQKGGTVSASDTSVISTSSTSFTDTGEAVSIGAVGGEQTLYQFQRPHSQPGTGNQFQPAACISQWRSGSGNYAVRAAYGQPRRGAVGYARAGDTGGGDERYPSAMAGGERKPCAGERYSGADANRRKTRLMVGQGPANVIDPEARERIAELAGRLGTHERTAKNGTAKNGTIICAGLWLRWSAIPSAFTSGSAPFGVGS